MFPWFISLLILVIVVVSPFVVSRYIISNFSALQAYRDVNERERQDQIITRILDSTQRIIDCQNALAKLVDKHSTSVTFREEQFNALARADVLAARREELLRTKELKIALERLMGVALTSRQPPAPNDVLALENLERRIEELEKILERTIMNTV